MNRYPRERLRRGQAEFYPDIAQPRAGFGGNDRHQSNINEGPGGTDPVGIFFNEK